MRVTINGELQDLPGEMTLSGLLVYLQLTEGPVAVERNGEIAPRASRDGVVVKEGDVLEIVHFVGGG